MTWDPSSGLTQRRIKAYLGMMNYIRSVAFSHDGTLLASASLNGTAKLWDPDMGTALRTLKDISCVRDVSFSPDSVTLYAGTLRAKSFRRIAAGETSCRGSKPIERTSTV
jgi:WD40 repeat protein